MIDAALFVGKRDDDSTQQALDYLKGQTRQLTFALGAWGEDLPEHVRSFRGEYIFSYLSRWILPGALLDRARAAVNFHPAPPEYPGIGCANFALYDRSALYGVTSHHMLAKVDSGEIIQVRRFPVAEDETLSTLLDKTYREQLLLFRDIVGAVSRDEVLPKSTATWAKKPTTWKDLRRLQTLDTGMSREELDRRIRATSFKQWQPHLVLHGHRFDYRP